MATTVQAVVDQTILELSQVPGVSTQVYSTPRIQQYVEDAFNIIFRKNWWRNYVSFITATLDGTTGHLTADLLPTSPISTPATYITRYDNIRSVFLEGTNKAIKELPLGQNPFIVSGSTTAIYKRPDYTYANRPIIFYPTSAVGNVVLEVRQEPVYPFGLSDTLYLDKLLLVYGAAYFYAVDDGTNPGQITKFESLFEDRLKQLMADEGEGSISLDPRFNYETDQWWERS